jgi:DedD protein
VDRSQYKQRIVGGLVLVALGAIVIPFLLDMHKEDQWWGKGNIPKKPDNGFVTRVLPLNEWSKQAKSELMEGAAASKVDVPAAKSDAVTPSPAIAPTPPPALTPTPTPKAPAIPSSPPVAPGAGGTATALEGWVVQLGSFSSEKNAEDLREQLLKKGYRVFVDHLKQGGQTIYRVRIAPEQQRAAAEAIRNQVEHDLKLKAIVLHMP